RVLKVGLVHAQLPGHDLVARQHGGDRVQRVAVARDHYDIAPVDDVADIGQALKQVLREGHGRAKLDPLLGLDPVGQVGRGVDGHDAARVDEGHAAAEAFGLFHEVGDQDDRDPALAHALDQVPGFVPGGRVQAGGELVQHR